MSRGNPDYTKFYLANGAAYAFAEVTISRLNNVVNGGRFDGFTLDEVMKLTVPSPKVNHIFVCVSQSEFPHGRNYPIQDEELDEALSGGLGGALNTPLTQLKTVFEVFTDFPVITSTGGGGNGGEVI